MKINLNTQAGRFIAIGAINTLIAYGLYVFFLWLGFHYTIAAFLGTCISIVINYFTISLGVFGNRDGGRNPKRFILFILFCGGNYCVSIVSIWFFIQYGINEYIAGLLAVFPVSSFSFVVNKYIVFRSAKK